MVEAEPHEESGERREFLKYTFYQIQPGWRRLPVDVKRTHASEFVQVLHKLEDLVILRTYSLQGIRADADFMLWTIDPRLETFPEIARRVASTQLGPYLDTTYAYLAATKRSSYLGDHAHTGQDGLGGAPLPLGSRYLFVYPFVKKREWYSIPFDHRQEIMREHFRIGHKFPSVTIHTGYSFGLDDQEFVLAFESDEPLDFLDLVMELRSSEASRYTERETPIFTCLRATPEQIVDALGT